MPRFRTTELSDPRFESDNLRFITVKTPNLKGRGDICVFVPQDVMNDDLPVVILLHGVYGSAWAWARKGGAHRTATGLIAAGKIPPCILAMPSDGLFADGSAYLRHSGYNFERWITEDVIDAVRLNIPQAKASTTTYIAGLSMGGYGALRLGAAYPELFRGISGHSSITRLEEMSLFVEENISVYRQPVAGRENVVDLILENQDRLPPLRFDCGTEDELIDGNRALHRQLTEAGVDHVYQEFAGGHEWAYWEEHLGDTLLFFLGDAGPKK
ncbi:esterase family protein [Neolewinella aurantiaca]|uniref:Esterase family protein n=1 Tax=Neolewinella aurantiaca TaxID=2602767 RepID=A0A5C7FG31_9BACT|nr:alpha/beta hydrolase-fold protein [Neolewinella aurantiaca]TXF89907.1 esterase family protein [Neolewinella aurantiaca]